MVTTELATGNDPLNMPSRPSESGKRSSPRRRSTTMRMTKKAKEKSLLLPPKVETVVVTPRKTMSEHEGRSLW